jgi:hypothetical protein
MAMIIRYAFAAFWTATTGFLVFLVYTTVQTETDPRGIWAWLVFCGITFISVTWLTYNVLFARYHKQGPKHHDLHLAK